MSSPRSDRSFWLVTLALALAPCVTMIVVLYAWPPPALAAAPPAEPLRAPPPQLVLPVASHAWNVGADYDLLGVGNRFGDGATPQLLPLDESANAARDPNWQPSPGQRYDAHWRRTALQSQFAYRPDDDAVFAIVELHDCRYGAAVLRTVEILLGEMDTDVEVRGAWACKRSGDRIELTIAADCVSETNAFRVGELLILSGSAEGVAAHYPGSVSPSEVAEMRAMIRASMTKPPWPIYD